MTANPSPGRARNSARLITLLCNFVTEWLLRRTQRRRNFSTTRFRALFRCRRERKLRLLLNFIMFCFFFALLRLPASAKRKRHFELERWGNYMWNVVFFYFWNQISHENACRRLSSNFVNLLKMRWNLKTLLMFSAEFIDLGFRIPPLHRAFFASNDETWKANKY